MHRVKDQGRTKEEPRMNQRTPKYKMCVLLRLPSLFPLIPCLILPTDDREKTERTPHQLPAYKKCFLLRLPEKGYSTFRKK